MILFKVKTYYIHARSNGFKSLEGVKIKKWGEDNLMLKYWNLPMLDLTT